MKTELDSLATALYVKTDDLLKDSPQLAPSFPTPGPAALPDKSCKCDLSLSYARATKGFRVRALLALRYSNGSPSPRSHNADLSYLLSVRKVAVFRANAQLKTWGILRKLRCCPLGAPTRSP